METPSTSKINRVTVFTGHQDASLAKGLSILSAVSSMESIDSLLKKPPSHSLSKAFMKFLDPSLERKINNDVSKQGFSTVDAPNWYFTIGLARKGMNDLIVPKAGMTAQHFRRLASVYAAGEVGKTGKIITEEILVKGLLGPEPARFELIEAEAKDSAVFKDQMTSNLFQDHPFQGFTMIQVPDDDNRLFGESECLTDRSVKRALLDQVFVLDELIKKQAQAAKDKELDAQAERAHAAKVLNKVVPKHNMPKKKPKQGRVNYNKRNKSAKK